MGDLNIQDEADVYNEGEEEEGRLSDEDSD